MCTSTSTQLPLVLSFNPRCFTSLIFEALPVQSLHLETAFAFGLYPRSAKIIPGSFLHLGMVFCLQHHTRKSYVISLAREDSQMLIRQQPWEAFWPKAFWAQVWDTSQLFLMLYIFSCIDDDDDDTLPQIHCPLTTDWAVMIDICIPGINEQMWEKEVKHFPLEL